MPLSYVLDENLRGPLWNLLSRPAGAAAHPIDVVRVGDSQVVPLGTKDPYLLRWAEERGRVLVSEDRRSMAKHLAAHLAAGRRSPGIMIPRTEIPLREVADFLVLAAYATDPTEWADAIHYVP